MTAVTAQHALTQAHANGVARLDAQWLLLHALGRPSQDRGWLLAHDDLVLTDAQIRVYDGLLQRRAQGEPLAYLVGSKEFFGLTLQVDARVLVPRPDTETLVYWAVEVLGTIAIAEGDTLDLLDLGTGSGAVALALAHELLAQGRSVRTVAVDASQDALTVASANAAVLGLAVKFIHSDWLAHVAGRFHLIVSNPPYVAAADPHLAALQHEPTSALTSGPDGLNDLRVIISQAPAHLHHGGWLLLEHGYDQAAAVRDLLAHAGFVELDTRLDLAGITRCSGGQWLGLPDSANSEIIASS